MKLTTEQPQRLRFSPLLLLFSLALLLNGCDVLEEDQRANDGDVQLSDKALYISPDGPGIINLRSLIENGSTARISVSSQPIFGSLRSLGDDLLQYTPNAGVTEATDAFRVSIFGSNNIVLNEDTVTIIITRDSTSLPCGLYATTDYVYNVSSSVDIPVLANDTSCNVATSQLIVSIPDLVIDGVAVPKSYFGSLALLPDGRIRYTPGPDFAGEDKFIYRVTKPANVPNHGDPELMAHGFVYIQGVADCRDSLNLFDDLYSFGYDSIAQLSDSLYLDVKANDILCDEAANDYVYTLTSFPQRGTAGYFNEGFMYTWPDSLYLGYEDRFRYKICVDGVCDEAEVIIKLE
jgi:hypothetical protein